MDRYLARISGPLIDRIDLHIEVPAVPFKHLSAPANGTGSDAIRATVHAARAVQAKRQGVGHTNSELARKSLDKYAQMTEPARVMLGQAMNELGLSARAYDKVRRVSRTIADLETSAVIDQHHVAEAVQYRVLDRQV
jgi:magnesium chelatase family protein